MIHNNILERNESFEQYVQGYENLFCRNSNLAFRKLTPTSRQKHSVENAYIYQTTKHDKFIES